MKGIMFTEFMEWVDDKFGFDIADQIIEESDLASGGAYTQVGDYDHHELINLVTKLSEKTKVEDETLLNLFGEHLIVVFHQKFPQHFLGVNNCFELLNTIESKVYIEVKKLYPKTELATFETLNLQDDFMEMEYISERPFSNLVFGMITGAAIFFKEEIEIKMEDLSTERLTRVNFKLTKNG